MMRTIWFIRCILAVLAWCGSVHASSPVPTYSNVKYDVHERTVLDFGQAEGEGKQDAAPSPDLVSTVSPAPSSLKKFMPGLFREKLEEARKGGFDLVMIGDSITHGWHRYPDELTDVRYLNLGFPGDRTQNVLWRIQHGALDEVSPKLVTLLIGTNHLHPAKKNYNPDHPEDVFTGIQAVVGEVRARIPDAKIVVFSVLPRKPGEANDRVSSLNALLPGIQDDRHVFYVNISHAFLRPDGSFNSDLYNKDGLHLSPAGYKVWSRIFMDLLKKEGLTEDRITRLESEVSQTVWPGKKSSFHGFDQYDFLVGAAHCKVVLPKVEADGKPWVWRARFWGHEPQFDIGMLQRGYHIAYCDVANLFGNSEAVARWNSFYEYLRFEHLFSDRPILEGMSRGGLIVYNWAAANPDKVEAIYGDAPVMDFKSWPGGKGAGRGAAGAWATCLKAYGLTEDEALTYTGIPLEQLEHLAKAGIPIIHVVGDADDIVPVAENTAIAETRYKSLGGEMKVIHKPGVKHHPHSLKDPGEIIEFVSRGNQESSAATGKKIVSDRNFILRGDFLNSHIQFEQSKRGHVAFIGGSITEMNGYRPMVCDILKTRFPETDFHFTQAGISSTCSDTGAFRLHRDVLSEGPLDMLFVEFAVNDDQDARQSYHNALRGMEGIIVQAREHNPYVDIVVTFFANQNILQDLQQGKIPPSIDAHSRVAEHHGISVNHLAQELADQIQSGKTDWKTYGGVHPKEHGNRMCASMIEQALIKSWSLPLPVDAKRRAHPTIEPVDSKSYVRGRFLPAESVQTDSHWKRGVPDWPNENRGLVRPRFLNASMIYSDIPHARLTLPFTGTAVGAYLLAGPDTGIIRCTVDGKLSRDIDTLHHHSGFNYPMTVMFFDELEDGAHTLELEILENRPGRIKPGGTAFRAISFVGN